MFRLFAVLLFCGAFLVATPTVWADPGGATVIDQDYACSTDPDFDFTICTSMRVVRNTAVQPDGDQSHTAHTDYTSNMYGPTGLILSSSESQDFHYLSIEELFQEMHLRTSSSLTIPGVLSCQTESFFHLANEHIQFDRYDVDCEPPL
jgi:hypothetical protein